jgi:uncharacterized protein YukE
MDAEIAAAKKQAKDIIKAFQEGLTSQMAGRGAFGDFWRELMEWKMKTVEFLDAAAALYGSTSQKYLDAVRDVNTSMRLLLEDARRRYEGQLLDFEETALSSLERVLDLEDERVDLAQQLLDIDKQRKDLIKEEADLKKDIKDLDKDALEIREDQAGAAKDLAEARQERAERLLDIEKQIRDLLVEAAETESEIRRRGILEAQVSVAEQKASEISKLRGTTSEKLDELRKERSKIASDRSAEEAYQDRVDKVKEQMEDLAERRLELQEQLVEMQDRFEELDRNIDRVREQQGLNRVRLNFARQVADIERGMTGDMRSRIDIETRRGQIAVLNARETVLQWKEVRDIVNSIIGDAENLVFNPPEGFPIINIHVGNINIDNSVATTTPVTGGDDGKDDNGDDRGDRRPPRDRRKEWDEGRDGFEVYR